MSLTPEMRKELARKVVDILCEKRMMCDAAIYVNNEKWRVGSVFADKQGYTDAGNPYQIESGVNVCREVVFGGSDDIVVTFDRDLYHEINHGDGSIQAALSAAAAPYGLCWEKENTISMHTTTHEPKIDQ